MVDHRAWYLLIFALAAAVGAVGVNGMQDVPDWRDEPPIVLIVLESTRADHIGPCYGYDRTTAPHLCALADDGVMFTDAHSQGPWTQTAMPSLLTSQWPSSVGLPRWGYRLPSETPLLAERLEESGYQTAANDVGALADSGMLQGVRKSFTLEGRVGEVYAHAGSSASELETGLELFDSVDRPFFLMHMYRRFGHAPYDPPAPHDRWANDTSRSSTVNDYNGEIRAADARIGTVVKALEERGVYDQALIIVTADHGELLPEGGHEAPPRSELTHVPLIVKFPGNRWAGRTVTKQVRHVDIVPTITDIAGAGDDADLAGQSLVPFVTRGGQDRPTVAGLRPDRHWTLRTDGRVYRLTNVRGSCLSTEPSDHSLHRENQGGVDSPDLSSRFPELTEHMRDGLCQRYLNGIRDRPSLIPLDN